MFSNTSDCPRLSFEERSQARARISFGAIALLYLCFLLLYQRDELQGPLILLALLPLGLLVYSGLQWWWLSKCLPFSVVRQRITIVFDLSVTSCAMAVTGEWGAIWYPLLLWIVIGNGMRFGLGYMRFSIGVAVPCFAAVLAYSGYWSQNRIAGLGLLLGIFILPAFFSVVLRRLHHTNKQLENELEHSSYLANHDTLTGLANRLQFNLRLTDELNRAKRGELYFTVLFMDLDRFKGVNDQYGHDTGDKLLIEVAGRIQHIVRETDLAARIGGDEFGFITASSRDPIDVERMKSRLETEICRPYTIDGNPVAIGTSIGIARYPDDGSDTKDLLTHSDHMMYQQKTALARN